ncbi:hypothetical protein OIU74_015971 [Salix koriyanagi]|uniref:Uncharacterized protein n=1 Tax=Salix koriyanagi TaxID=2511006 RepID=A0A9Q0PN41_9ROSI|nr:hypothetical protein OIU74_015971 [Salix koriyanagi]
MLMRINDCARGNYAECLSGIEYPGNEEGHVEMVYCNFITQIPWFFLDKYCWQAFSYFIIWIRRMDFLLGAMVFFYKLVFGLILKLYKALEEDTFRPVLHHYDGPKLCLALSVPETLDLLDLCEQAGSSA